MRFSRYRRSRVGVDIGSSSVKVALVTCQGTDRYRLEHWGSQDLPSGTIANGSIRKTSVIVNAIRKLLAAARTRGSKTAITLPTQLVLLKKLLIPQLPEADLADSLRWEIAQHMPGELDEVCFDYSTQPETGHEKHSECLMAATRKENIAEFGKVIRLAGLHLSIVDVEALTLQNLYLHSYGPDSKSLKTILNIGAATTNVTILRGNSLILSRLLPLGGHQHRDVLKNGLGLSSKMAEHYLRLPNAPANIRALLDEVSGSLALEIRKILSHCQAVLPTPAIDTVRLCGGGSLIQGLRETLSRSLELPVLPLDPLRKLESRGIPAQEEDLAYCRARIAVATGLALRMAREQ